MQTTSARHFVAATLRLQSARNCQRIIRLNPERRDIPAARAIVAAHVNAARAHNHTAIAARRKEATA